MKPKGQYWDKFVEIHSGATSAWVYDNFGKAFTREELVQAHLETCASRYSSLACGKNLYDFLIKWKWVTPK